MVSIAGTQMQVTAIHWHIRELTEEPDPLALGGIGLARILPVIVFSLSVSTIIRNTIRQLSTPDHIRGRMTSINQIFFQGGPQLGEVRAGLVASA